MAEGADLPGDGVNVAARLQAVAQPAGIWAALRACRTAPRDQPS